MWEGRIPRPPSDELGHAGHSLLLHHLASIGWSIYLTLCYKSTYTLKKCKFALEGKTVSCLLGVQYFPSIWSFEAGAPLDYFIQLNARPGFPRTLLLLARNSIQRFFEGNTSVISTAGLQCRCCRSYRGLRGITRPPVGILQHFASKPVTLLNVKV